MATAAPLPVPATAPKAPSAPAPTPPVRPRVGELHDSGTVRKEFVNADRWFATGYVKVTGDVQVGQGKIDGTITIGGKLAASDLQYRGMVDILGTVDVIVGLAGSGSMRAEGALHAGTAEFKGTAQLDGPLTVDKGLSVHGSLSAPSAKVGELDLDGEAHIPGELVGDRVVAFLKESSSFGTVRARSVTLHGKPPNLVEKVFFRRVTVKVERVEADAADLESVDVYFVRAPQITLGRNAHVTEYEGTIVKRHPTSRVGFESKSAPPYGLRRAPFSLSP